jgi:hypothetical protein
MAHIKIVAIPLNKDVPNLVSEKWVELILPIAEDVPFNCDDCYPVETNIAIRTLMKKSVEAGKWWNKFLVPKPLWISFDKNVCQLI